MDKQPSPSGNPWASPRFWMILVAVALVFAVGIRVQGLGRKTMHHDESIHAYYGWRIADQGRVPDDNPADFTYTYDPVYHGPVLYHIGALFFLLFGDSDATARMPMMVAGLFLLYLVWLLFKDDEDSTKWWALVFVGVSPALIYYSRFAVHDMYLACWYTGIVVFGIRYWRDGREKDFFLTVLFLALMYYTKTNSYMHGFIIGFSAFVFTALALLVPSEWRDDFRKQLFGKRAPLLQLAGLYALFSGAAFLYARLYYEQGLLPGGKYHDLLSRFPGRKFGGWFIDSTAQSSWFHSHWQGFSIFYWILFIIVAAAFLVLLSLISFGVLLSGDKRKRKASAKTDDETESADLLRWINQNWMIIVSVAGIIIGYAFLYTTMFANPERLDPRTGALAPVKPMADRLQMGVVDYLSYWFGQNESHRLAGGPGWYYYRLWLYETAGMALLIAGIGWFCLTQLKAMLASELSPAAAPEKGKKKHEPARGAGSELIYYLMLLVAGVVFFSFFLYYLLGPGSSHPGSARGPITGWQVAGFALLGGFLLYPYVRLFYQRPLRAFLIFWALASLLIYAKLGEKGPWLLVHQALPVALVAAATMGDVCARVRAGWLRGAVLVIPVVLLAFEVHAAILLNVYYEDDAREAMVYVQTAPEVKTLLHEIDTIAGQSGLRENLPISVGTEVNWPFVWYLRHYKFTPALANPRASAIVMEHADPAGYNHQRLMTQLGEEFTWRKLRLQNWWDNPQDKLLAQMRQQGTSGWFFNAHTRRMVLDYYFYRKPWSAPGQPPMGSKDMYVYLKKNVVDHSIVPEKRDYPEGGGRPVRALAADPGFGAQGRSPVRFNEPRGLFAAGGNVYVCDSHNGRVVVLNAQGQEVREMGKGELSSKFSGPSALVANAEGEVWVTDTWYETAQNNFQPRIVHFGADGQMLGALELQQGSDHLYGPRGIARNSRGEIIITDTGNHKLRFFSSEGRLIRSVGQQGSAPGQFIEPVGIAVGTGDRIYVADTGNRRIQMFDSEGRFLHAWNVPGFLGEDAAITGIEPMVAIGPDGRVYVTDSSMQRVMVFSGDGSKMQSYGVSGQLQSPKGVAVDEQGRIYVSQTGAGNVIRYQPVTAP